MPFVQVVEWHMEVAKNSTEIESENSAKIPGFDSAAAGCVSSGAKSASPGVTVLSEVPF